MQSYHANIRHDIVPLVPECARLLDVGGGTGVTARHLKEIGRVREAGVLDAVVADHAEGLDFWSDANLEDPTEVEGFLAEAGPFDAVLMLDVLEHLVDPWAAVDQFASAVKPGGVLVASIPNVRHISVVSDLVLRGKWNYSDSGILDRTHLRFFVKDTAVALMERPGLTIERVVQSDIATPRRRLFNRLTFGFFRDFMTLHYFIVARRDAG
jgi:SAM-dependent methyltransferase